MNRPQGTPSEMSCYQLEVLKEICFFEPREHEGDLMWKTVDKTKIIPLTSITPRYSTL